MVLQVNNYCGLPNGTSVTFLEHHELLYIEMCASHPNSADGIRKAAADYLTLKELHTEKLLT